MRTEEDERLTLRRGLRDRDLERDRLLRLGDLALDRGCLLDDFTLLLLLFFNLLFSRNSNKEFFFKQSGLAQLRNISSCSFTR
jgi:hypothetical protein